MRFGLGEYEEDHTLEEIGTKYKVTKEAIRVKIDNLLR
jgi:DNA-directed RNA polymerase sigma subunit (sigma70/sigma32)